MGKKSLIATTCLLILIFLMSGIPATAKGNGKSDRYTATTQDGVDLALKRYRPDKTASFRDGAQPIILMPGLVSNMNEFDVRTPEGEKYDIKLPAELAPWANGDKYIKKDPMKYYSMAHYLWLQGYDVWMANYRGEGREPCLSGGMNGYSMDDLGIYDCPAVVEKVYEVTGKHPVWLGHSMGSSMAYIYLEGSKYGDGDNPHVVSDPALAQERNGGNGKQSLKGFIDLDGPMVPFNGGILDNFLVWILIYGPWYIDLRPMTVQYGEYIADPVFSIGDMLWNICKMFGLPDLGPINAALSIAADNLDPAVGRFAAEYAVDGFSTRTIAQYLDASAHGVFREDYCNGEGAMIPPDPSPGDGYYCYSDHLDKIKLPALVLADDRFDITQPSDIEKFYLSKTRDGLDAFIRVPDSAHVDIVCGLNSPTITFPEIGKWLKNLL